MRRLKRTLLVSAAGVLLAAGPAPAFYFNGWPGSGEPIRRSLIQPGNENQPGNPPPVSPPPGVPPGGSPPPVFMPPTIPGEQPPGVPPGVPPSVPPGEQPPPEHVPEPATGLLGLLGLSAAVAARWLRRKQ
jgi:MYXO-CTERM domain-containing protein